MRPLIASIRLNHLRENFLTLKQMHGGGKMLAVVKADAYGHGAVPCAKALADLTDGYAVACIEEAIELRQAGLTLPIVLLEGVFAAEEYALVDQYRLWPVVGNAWQLASLLDFAWQKPLTVWLKMDSGMHRTGFFPHDYAAAFKALSQCPQVESIVKITHFACADEPVNGMTADQLHTFDLACAALGGDISVANSAAMMAYPQTQRGWGRAGLALYGISPMAKTDNRFKPVMRLSSQVFGERVLPAGEAIGYGASFVTTQSTRVGLVACGYADGYPRRASTGTPIAVAGERTRVLGRVSMDMMTIELHDHQHGVGSEVELWGDVVNVNEIAAAAGTIAYELLCHVKRARKIYRE
ncbi:alanine racemase [Neisseriaceae bacterium ESL0693]|nr:alanine racemase [Neisseriaceae bacterium ESL0693]